MIAFVVIVACLLDSILGEPKRYHPLVGFGYLATVVERYFNRFSRFEKFKFRSFLLGALAWFILVLVPTILVVLLLAFINSPILSTAMDIVILYLAIGHTSLRQHALAVWHPLQQVDLSGARQQLAKIVSRDTDKLDETEVRKATIESVLENGSDAIFAPLFWFCIGGLPAVIIYRLSNTLDAMWGYKTERFNYFGRFSARMDDMLNYLPSRLVALTYALLGNTRSAFWCWRKQAALLDSPSAGVVMTAGAGALQLRLGGDGYYHGKLKAKPEFGCGSLPIDDDIPRSLSLLVKTLFLWCAVIAILVLINTDSLFL